MNERRVAEVFPPGDFIKEELEARGWSQTDLAEIMGCQPSDVNGLITGRRSFTPEVAKALGAVFGTSAQLWMNLDSSYKLYKAAEADAAMPRRAVVYGFAPVREMIKRGWIEASESIDVLEHRVRGFFGQPDLNKPLALAGVALRGKGEITPVQAAWVQRARQLARAVHVAQFSDQSFENAIIELKKLLPSTQRIGRVPMILADAGIRFVIVEGLPKARIDGATIWLDKAPVIALSLRYDRVDSFWFTLFHELAHVKRRDGLGGIALIDDDLLSDKATPTSIDDFCEAAANQFATEQLAPGLDDFIARVSPLFMRARIVNYATRVGVHPGIVVGQLQFRDEISYGAHRSFLEKVRHIITETALTDGWGDAPYIPDDEQSRVA